jgi:hypothetical protein
MEAASTSETSINLPVCMVQQTRRQPSLMFQLLQGLAMLTKGKIAIHGSWKDLCDLCYGHKFQFLKVTVKGVS